MRTISLFLEKRLHAVAPAVPLFRFPGYTDFELFSSSAETHPEGGPIVAVGGLYPVKGFGHLLRAWRRVADESREAQLVLVGEGPLRQTLDEEAAELEVSDRIRFVSKLQPGGARGSCTGARASWSFHRFRRGSGGWSGKPWHRGLPVVASNVGGIPDLVVDGETGFLVPSKDEEALGERILWLLEHPEKARAMGAAGRKAVQSRFSTELYVEGYRELFEDTSATF